MRTPDKRRDIDRDEADAQLPNRNWFSQPSKIALLGVFAAVAVFIFVLSNMLIQGGQKKEAVPVTHATNNGIPWHRTEINPEPATITMPPLAQVPAIEAVATGPSRNVKPATGSLFAFTADSQTGTGAQKAAAEGSHEEQSHLVSDDDPLTSSLRASNISKPAKAHVLKHARRVIPRGTAIPCLLKTRINTSRPGLVVCDSKEEVRGWGGTVMLLPRWTRFTGQISQGLTVDQDRVDVLWTSALTPDDIEITINSPAADMLGSPGLNGEVDNHVGEKILAVLLYTAIEAGPALAVQALQNQGHNNNNGNGGYSPYSYNQIYQPGQGVAGKLLEQKLNRPPILVKNQGEEIVVMVAQNWDLSDVIGLEPVR